MHRILDLATWGGSLLAAVCMVLSLLATPSPVLAGGSAPPPCAPVDRKSGGPPCFDKAGAQCYFAGKPSSCTASPNGSNCTCAVI